MLRHSAAFVVGLAVAGASASGARTVDLPAPSQAVPRTPARLAPDLERTTNELTAAIDRWRTRGSPARGAPPRDVTLLALYQQRIYRLLSREPRLARTTVSRLPPTLRRFANDTLTARRVLSRLATPTPRRAVRTGRPIPAGTLLRHYRKAERRFHVSWAVLASVNFVESAFGRVRSARCALRIQTLDRLRHRRPRARATDAARPAQLLRVLRVAGVRADAAGLPQDHGPALRRRLGGADRQVAQA